MNPETLMIVFGLLWGGWIIFRIHKRRQGQNDTSSTIVSKPKPKPKSAIRKSTKKQDVPYKKSRKDEQKENEKRYPQHNRGDNHRD